MIINDVNRALVLASLYNHSRPQGMSFMQYKQGHVMTEEEAKELLKARKYFDYLYGRVMKVDLSGNSVDFFLYDRYNGNGAGNRACRGLEV